MPAATAWHDEARTIIHMQISDPWTLPDLTAATQESYRLMAQVTNSVDLIMDFSRTTGLPRNVFSHYATHTTEASLPANQGFVLVIVRGTLLQTFAGMAKRILPNVTRKMYVVDSLAAADTKIASLRESASSAK